MDTTNAHSLETEELTSFKSLGKDLIKMLAVMIPAVVTFAYSAKALVAHLGL